MKLVLFVLATVLAIVLATPIAQPDEDTSAESLAHGWLSDFIRKAVLATTTAAPVQKPCMRIPGKPTPEASAGFLSSLADQMRKVVQAQSSC